MESAREMGETVALAASQGVSPISELAALHLAEAGLTHALCVGAPLATGTNDYVYEATVRVKVGVSQYGFLESMLHHRRTRRRRIVATEASSVQPLGFTCDAKALSEPDRSHAAPQS